MAKGKGGAAPAAAPVTNNRRNGKAPKKNPKAPNAGATGKTVGGYKAGSPKALAWSAAAAADKRRARSAARAARRDAIIKARVAKGGGAKRPVT